VERWLLQGVGVASLPTPSLRWRAGGAEKWGKDFVFSVVLENRSEMKGTRDIDSELKAYGEGPVQAWLSKFYE
jgi:hypothetical protein